MPSWPLSKPDTHTPLPLEEAMGSTGRLEGCPGKLAGRVQEGFPDGIAGCWKLQLFKDYAPPPQPEGQGSNRIKWFENPAYARNRGNLEFCVPAMTEATAGKCAHKAL